MGNIAEKINQAEKLKDDGEHEQAIALLDEVLAEDAEHILAHLMLGRIYTLTGKFDQAVAHSEKACELEPNSSFNFTALSVTYQKAWAGTQDQKYIQLAEDAMAKSKTL